MATKQRRGHCHPLPASRTIHAISEARGGLSFPSQSPRGQVLPIPTVCTKGLLGHEGVYMASQLLFLPTQPAWLSWAMMVREIQTGKIYTPAFLLSPSCLGLQPSLCQNAPVPSKGVAPRRVIAFGFGSFRHPDRRI